MTTNQNVNLTCEMCNVTVQHSDAFQLHLSGKKHQKLAEFMEFKKQTEEKGIYVRGFRKTVNENILKTFFQQFGEINKFIFGDQGRYAIIHFKNRESAQTCLSKRLYFHGSQLQIKKAQVREHVNAKIEPVVNNCLDDGHVMTVLSSCKPDFESQVMALMDEILLSDCTDCITLCAHLEQTFSPVFPGSRAHPFGSTVTGLAFKGSDVDVFIATDAMEVSVPDSSSLISSAKRQLYRNSRLYSNIIPIPKAKTPIVKLVHVPTGLHCDLSFKSALGVQNTALIRYLLSQDTRLRPLLVIIKYWARLHELTGPGKLSNYALTMLVLFYLQQLRPSIVLPVTVLQENCRDGMMLINGWACSIDTSLPHSTTNKSSVPQLLHGFFKFCSQFDFGLKVICPLIGDAIPKALFQSPDQLPEAMYRFKQNEAVFKVDSDMCIQDPFELDHNLTAGVTLRALQNLKNHCTAAETVCNTLLAPLPEQQDTPPFLWKLFSSKPSQELMWSKEVAHVTIFLRSFATTAGDEDAIREQWYEAVRGMLVEILQKIMHLETRLEEIGRSASKIQKVEGQSDTADNGSVIHCAGYYRLWEGRRGISKKLKFSEGIGTMARECMISDSLLEKQKKTEHTDDQLITTFTCTLRPRQAPTRVALEFADKKSFKGDFKAVASLLQTRLPTWIEQCMKEKQTDV